MGRKKTTKNTSMRTKLTILESIFGQKEAAKKLGVSVATFRNWKTGKHKKPLDPEKEKKINRTYGQNKKKADYNKIKKTVKSERSHRKGKERQLLNRIEQNNPFIIKATTFIKKIIKDKESIERFLSSGIEHVATFDYMRGQLVTPFDIVNRYYGKPKNTRKVHGVGLYSNHYAFEADSDNYKGYMSSSKIPTMDGWHEDWGLSKTLDYLERKFLETPTQVGKRRDNAIQFIAYYL